MSLTAILRSAVSAGMDALGDLKTTCTYTHVDGDPTYNPATGGVTASNTTIASVPIATYRVRGVDRMEGAVLRTLRGVIEERHLSSIDPHDGDWVTLADGTRWQLHEVQLDGGVAYTFRMEAVA